jgi:hypothetical protein
LSSPGDIPDSDAGAPLSLPPYAAWVAAVRAPRPAPPGGVRRAQAAC